MADIKNCQRIYEAAFGVSPEFDDALFGNYFDCCITSESGAAMLFLLPAIFEYRQVSRPARYIYAAATEKERQNNGEMTELIKKAVAEAGGPVFLKPALPTLAEFYKKRGFSAVKASPYAKGARLIGLFPELSALCSPEKEEFTMMQSGLTLPPNGIIRFADTLE